MVKSRGFITIATGQERYYVLAQNLLHSYRQFATIKYPFAIIADRENEYTKEFDDVIIIKNPNKNYMDKLALYDYIPYDETLFIDADSLAYGDLDSWWELFEGKYDFSVFGYAWENINSGRGWFRPEGLKEYKDKVSYIPDFNGGVYYLTKSDKCKRVFELANYFAIHYKEYSFTGFSEPADEPCLALAMAIETCRPLDYYELAFAPANNVIELDISLPRAHYYRKKDQEYDVRLIHWGNYKTRQALYRFEVEKLNKIMQNKDNDFLYKVLYKRKLRYQFLRIGNIPVFAGRVIRKIKKVAHNYNKNTN